MEKGVKKEKEKGGNRKEVIERKLKTGKEELERGVKGKFEEV